MQSAMIRGVTPLFRRTFQAVAPQQSKVLTPGGLRTMVTSTSRPWAAAALRPNFLNTQVSTLARIPAGRLLVQRGFASRSLPRLGHNLEDHYDMAEFVCKIHSPLSEYVMWCIIIFALNMVVLPILHSNYYFTGRFLPKDQGNTQLNDDSW